MYLEQECPEGNVAPLVTEEWESFGSDDETRKKKLMEALESSPRIGESRGPKTLGLQMKHIFVFFL